MLQYDNKIEDSVIKEETGFKIMELCFIMLK